MQTPWRFRTKRNLWAYAGLAVVTKTSAEYEFVEGRPLRRRRAPLTRGLNRNYNRVLKDVLKMRVYRLARWRNREEEVIPVAIIDKPPSAELRPDQLDTDSLPPYDVLDAILEMYVESDASIRDIVAAGFDVALVERITRLVDRNEYKRRQSPPGVKITTKAFGKDRRLPITNWYRSG